MIKAITKVSDIEAFRTWLLDQDECPCVGIKKAFLNPNHPQVGERYIKTPKTAVATVGSSTFTMVFLRDPSHLNFFENCPEIDVLDSGDNLDYSAHLSAFMTT